MPTTTRVLNFSSGPAVLPVPVLEQVQRDLVTLPGVGMSVMEISHRSATFEGIIQKAEADIRIRGQMHHQFGPFHGPLEHCPIQQVLPVQTELRGTASELEKMLLAGREVIVSGDFVTVRQKPVDQIAGNESGSAGNKDLHVWWECF